MCQEKIVVDFLRVEFRESHVRHMSQLLYRPHDL